MSIAKINFKNKKNIILIYFQIKKNKTPYLTVTLKQPLNAYVTLKQPLNA
jgi:hypothetical protein